MCKASSANCNHKNLQAHYQCKASEMSGKQKGRTNFYLFPPIEEKKTLEPLYVYRLHSLTSNMIYFHFLSGQYDWCICLRISSCVYQKLGKIITGNSFIIFFFFYYSFSSDSNILIVTVNRINLTGVAGIWTNSSHPDVIVFF